MKKLRECENDTLLVALLLQKKKRVNSMLNLQKLVQTRLQLSRLLEKSLVLD